MIERLHKWLKVFNLKIFEYQRTTITEAHYIETRPDGEALENIRILRENLKEEFKSTNAEQRIAS